MQPTARALLVTRDGGGQVRVLHEEAGAIAVGLVLCVSSTRHEVPRILSQATSSRLYLHHLLSLPPAVSLLSSVLSRLLLDAPDYLLLLGDKTLAFLLDLFFSHTCAIGSMIHALKYATTTHFASRPLLARLCTAPPPRPGAAAWTAPEIDEGMLAAIAQLPSVKRLSGGGCPGVKVAPSPPSRLFSHPLSTRRQHACVGGGCRLYL
jgi:hypothetical protein